MRISEIVLPARDVDEVARFYAETLAVPVSRSGNRAAITVGTTELVWEPGNYDGVHHLAFTIPTGTFDAAREWIAGRATILSRDGVDIFEGPPRWNSQSVYFEGPEGQVLELIERRSLPGASSCEAELLSMSEVGVAVPDVSAAVAALGSVGLEVYRGPYPADFAAVGDAEGMLILVAPGRAWLPTADRLSGVSTVRIAAEVSGGVRLGPDQILVPVSGSSTSPAGALFDGWRL